MKISFSDIFWYIIIYFVIMSVYFTYNVTIFKNNLSMQTNNISIKSGDIVSVLKIIDGDEISVKLEKKIFVVRILGIKSLDPTINDPLVQNFAKVTLKYLEDTLLNKKIKLIFTNLKFDSKKRLLAYIELDGQDIGRIMVSKGLTIVFNRYPFSRINQYIKDEIIAQKSKEGLWKINYIKKRALLLKDLWEVEKIK